MMNKYLRERGDANIRSNADLISKATFYQDPNFPDRKQMRENTERQVALDTGVRLQGRFAVQSIVLQCMQEQRLDALVAPTASSPSAEAERAAGAERERPVAGRLVVSGTAGLSGDLGAGRLYHRGMGSRARGRRHPSRRTDSARRLPVGVDFVAPSLRRADAVP